MIEVDVSGTLPLDIDEDEYVDPEELEQLVQDALGSTGFQVSEVDGPT